MARADTAVPTVIDLGGAVRDLCLARTGTAPRRPHMITFNGGDYDTGPGGNTHALVSFVATGHVVFFDAATRTPVECIDVGLQAHAIWPTPDQRHAIVADQNGRKLHRIATDYADNSFTMETSFDLADCTTPSGGPCTTPLRDDNAPICPRVDASNRYTFATLRGGGMFVLDHNATPMRIVAEYDRSVIWTGCGAAEVGDKMYVNSGSLPGRPSGHDLYAFDMNGFSLAGTPPNTPAPACRLLAAVDATARPGLARRRPDQAQAVPVGQRSYPERRHRRGHRLGHRRRAIHVGRPAQQRPCARHLRPVAERQPDVRDPARAHAAVRRTRCLRQHAGRRGDPDHEGRQDGQAPRYRPPTGHPTRRGRGPARHPRALLELS